MDRPDCLTQMDNSHALTNLSNPKSVSHHHLLVQMKIPNPPKSFQSQIRPNQSAITTSMLSSPSSNSTSPSAITTIAQLHRCHQPITVSGGCTLRPPPSQIYNYHVRPPSLSILLPCCRRCPSTMMVVGGVIWVAVAVVVAVARAGRARGDGSIVVGLLDGKIRLYSITSMRQAKTAFPGLGAPITHVDVTYDGKWVLGTTDTYLVTEDGKQERHLVATLGNFIVIWNFQQVKDSSHDCYRNQQGLKSCYCYKIVLKDDSIVDSRFMHDKFAVSDSPEAPLVVATNKKVSSFSISCRPRLIEHGA
ncbi:hypothetical protein Droror1_Dr00025177 [Drosera rotundifolia]